MANRQVFGRFENAAVGPYDVKVESATGNGIPPTYAALDRYDSYIELDVISGDQSLTATNGYFYAEPNGRYKVTYKLLTDGVEEIRTDFMNFYLHKPRPVTPPPHENNDEEKKYETMEDLEEKTNDPSEKWMYKLLGKYQIESEYKGVRHDLASYIEPYWPRLEREILVFRGQRDPMVQEINPMPGSFFSTSLHELVSSKRNFLSHEKKCCLFVLHIQPGVKYFSYLGDINKAIQRYNEKRASGSQVLLDNYVESEVLIAGGGQFFQDKEKTKPGFREMSFEEMRTLGVTNVPDPYDKVENLFGPMTHTKNGKDVTQKTGVFEAYYFPPEPLKMGGSRKKTKKAKKARRNKRRVTRKSS